MSGDDHGTTNECGAIPPNVRGPVPCHLEPGHDGQHFSTSGCAGSEIHWRGVRAINAGPPRREARRADAGAAMTKLTQATARGKR